MNAACEVSVQRFQARRLEPLFDACFGGPYRTRLRGGRDEPLYQPASSAASCHYLYYREDYFASALHEVAHWCIAGERRRQLVDFGYWYIPDGRSRAQQAAFAAVESRPQALEYLFSRACGYPFSVSFDNLGGQIHPVDEAAFREAVYAAVCRYRQRGLPARALCFYRALAAARGGAPEPAALPVARGDFTR
jgi:elongation factor P hydroxylase